MPKIKFKDKSPIKIRTKKTSNGNYSLYLDIYSDGKRKKEYLKLYLLPEVSRAAKEGNKKTRELAEAIKTERLLSLHANKSTFFKSETKEQKMPFASYMDIAIKRMKDIRTKDYIRRYKVAEHWVRKYDNKTPIIEVNKQWIQGFIRFLTVTPNKHGRLLTQNTIHEYLIHIANILNNAVREGVITSNPTKSLQPADRPKKYESKRDYLTAEELNRLVATTTPIRYNNVRMSFLFACFCGLRYSDIKQLKWKHIRKSEGGLIIDKKLQKTQSMLHLPLNKKAISFLPPRTKEEDYIFSLPSSMATVESHIKYWTKAANISKHVTFHTGRHTFAVNILAKGGDVYTLSKLLGHKKVSTTQIYAEVLAENKKKTVELLDL